MTYTESEMREEDQEALLVERGMKALALYENKDFQDYMLQLADLFRSELFKTQPHEQKRREMFYYQTVALQSIIDLISSDISVLQTIEENNRTKGEVE